MESGHYEKKTTGQTSIRAARRIWNDLSREALARLREIATQHDFSVVAGDLIYLYNGWYVTHTGLIGLARRKRCSGIHVEAVDSLCDSGASRICPQSNGLSVQELVRALSVMAMPTRPMSPPLVHGAEMRVAETRAVNRALRKAYGIGICSVEEIGSFAEPTHSSSGVEEAACLQTAQREPGRPQGSRPTLPDHPPAPARSQSGQGLRHRFLRREDAARSHPRTSRELRHAPGRLGRKGPQCPALPAQQLSRAEKESA